MKTDAQALPAKIGLIAATHEHQAIIANLLQLYAHDFSEFHEVDLGEDGRFTYHDLPLYWSEANRFPFLVTADGKLAGFVLVKETHGGEDQKSWDMAEFFVLRSHRRMGLGTDVAHRVWRLFPGPWQVRVMEANEAGRSFWERSIAAFTGLPVASERAKKDGHTWHIF